MNKVPTTDEVDHITPEERKALMGYCEHCEHWWKFTVGEDSGKCTTCGGRASEQIGFQVMTQRTYQPLLHGKKKLKNKR